MKRHTAPTSSTPLTRQGGTALVLACTLLFLASPALAQPAPPGPDADPVQAYLEAIERAETMNGAYAVELVDLYYGMGQSLLEQGDLKWAREAFYQTVMVARVNDGPDSLEQARYLYSVAAIESQMGNRPAAVEVLDSIYTIHALHYGENNPDMLPGVQGILDWYRENFVPEGVAPGPSDHQNLCYLADRVAALTEARYGLGHPETALRYRELGQAHYEALRYFAESGHGPSPELVMDSEGSNNVVLYEVPVVNHLDAGEAAFQRAADSWLENAQANDLQRARAMAELGDWYLVFRYFRKARKQYEQAYELLVRSPEFHDQADPFLGAPGPLHFLDPAGPYATELQSSAENTWLEVSMAVSLTGRLYDIEIVKAPEAFSDEQRKRLRDHLAGTRFRPAVVNGRLQSVEGFIWKAVPMPVGPEDLAANG